MPDGEFEVGYVAGAHGVRGAVRIKLHNANSDALHPGTVLTLARKEPATKTQATIADAASVPGKPGLYRVQLRDVRGREAAEALKGTTVLIERNALPELGDDEFYLADTMGLAVVREQEPTHLGAVVGVTSNGVQDLFEIEWVDESDRKHRWLLPVVEGLVIDVNDSRVLVDVPEGFLPEPLEAS